jgi:hypothetical protein
MVRSYLQRPVSRREGVGSVLVNIFIARYII